MAIVGRLRLVDSDSRARGTAGLEPLSRNDWRIPGGEHLFDGRATWEIGNEIAIFEPISGRSGHGDLEGYRLQVSSSGVINDGVVLDICAPLIAHPRT